MGTYNCSKKEIYDKLESALDSLEGNINREEYREMANELADNYKYFTSEEASNIQLVR